MIGIKHNFCNILGRSMIQIVLEGRKDSIDSVVLETLLEGEHQCTQKIKT